VKSNNVTIVVLRKFCFRSEPEKKAVNELIHITISDNETINATPEHPFYVPAKGWTSAVNLRAGDVLYTLNGEYAVVEQVQHEILEKPVWVYNFEVADDHTYFVGENAVGVHNSCLNDELISALQAETGWSPDVIEAIKKNPNNSKEVADTLQRLNLTESKIGGRTSLIQEIDLTRKNEKGITNLELMKQGNAPLDSNGNPIELHHIAQTMDSPYAELPWDEHRGKGQYSVMHDLSKSSEINRPVFGTQRSNYWKERDRLLESE
jgi:hypothetical protein